MTDYPAQGRSRASRARRGGGLRRSGLIPVFVFAVLLVVILGGFLKTVIPIHKSSGSGWDGQTSLAIVVNSNPPAIIVYSKVMSKLGVFSLPNDLKYATGNANDPVKVVDTLFLGPGAKTESVLSNLDGVNISRFVYFKNPPNLQKAQVYEMFKQFSSLKTPISIILGKDAFSSDLSKMELLRLWWEVKGLTLSQIDFKNVKDFSEEVIGAGDKKFSAIDRESINHEMANYFDLGDHKDIEIIDNSGVSGSGGLAADMLGAYGWNVVKVSSSESAETDCSVIEPSGDQDAALLAGVLGCNIIREQNATSQNPVIMLGSNFAKRYF